MNKYYTRIQESISDIINIELISETSNKVFKVTTPQENLYVKFYEGHSFNIDNELQIYNFVDHKYLKELYCPPVDNNMAIFKELKGQTVADLSEDVLLKHIPQIINALISFFTSLATVKVRGYGSLDKNLQGQYQNFLTFLKKRQASSAQILKDDFELSSISQLIFDHYESIMFADQSLVPIDTNLKNIMLTDENEIKFIDPGEMISGPILMAYGDFVAHCYKTPLYDELLTKLKLNSDEEKLLHIYAIFSSLNILAFLKQMGVNNLREIIPYGHQVTFYELIKDHLEFLNINIKKR